MDILIAARLNNDCLTHKQNFPSVMDGIAKLEMLDLSFRAVSVTNRISVGTDRKRNGAPILDLLTFKKADVAVRTMTV